MISVNEARKILNTHAKNVGKQNVSLKASLGHVLAEHIHAPMDVPSFDNSAMDGYAIRLEATHSLWKITSTIQAGDTASTFIDVGQAARIFTGAKMPDGADTVIPQELVSLKNGFISYEGDRVKVGDHVRLKGGQCHKGNLILEKGTPLNAARIGLLASVGVGTVSIFKAPSVAYLITGNEIKEVGSPLTAGEIYNSNGPMLEALLGEIGIQEVSAYKARDEKESLLAMISNALERHELLILSGGISVGDYDFVKECMESLEVEELFYKIKQRPGKPLFAGKKGEKWVFALPGNPASVLSCFNQYVKPFIKSMLGYQEAWLPNSILALSHDYKKVAGFTFFVKGHKNGDHLEILDGQQSFNLRAFSKANCLVELDEEMEVIRAGTALKVFDL